MTKAQKISEMVFIAFAKTGSMREAWDEVFGPGAYDKLAGEVYDAVRARSGK